MRTYERVKRLFPVAAITATVLAVVASAGWGQHLNDPSRRASTPTVTSSTYSSHLVTGPLLPVDRHRDVESDLRARVLHLDPTLSVRLPDDLVDGGFHYLSTYVVQFAAADRAHQRSQLLGEHFEGSEFHLWGSRSSSSRYEVDPLRFHEPAGASTHLSAFVHGSLHMPGAMHATKPSVPSGLAFLDRQFEVRGHYREIREYFARGRYFAIVSVRADTDVSVEELRKDVALLARAQYARTTGIPSGSIGA